MRLSAFEVTRINGDAPAKCESCGDITTLRPFGRNRTEVCWVCCMQDGEDVLSARVTDFCTGIVLGTIVDQRYELTARHELDSDMLPEDNAKRMIVGLSVSAEQLRASFNKPSEPSPNTLPHMRSRGKYGRD